MTIAHSASTLLSPPTAWEISASIPPKALNIRTTLSSLPSLHGDQEIVHQLITVNTNRSVTIPQHEVD